MSKHRENEYNEERMRPVEIPPFALLLCCLLAFAPSPASAQTLATAPDWRERDLTDLSLEELLNIEITTVSRRPEARSRAPAAIHVITNEDIRRSGATTLPDILRTAPGVQVAQVHAHQWGVSARGFNDVFANKLLVMIDGRSIYTPLFSGVFWDMHHTPLEDIERIEIIRGPGASLWGANAVNGIINIITKSARDTQGTLISVAGGNRDRFIGTFRQGSQLGEDGFLRVYLDHHENDGFPTPGPMDGSQAWQRTQGGLRTDWTLSDISTLTVQGDVFTARLDETYIRTQPGPPFSPYIDPSRNRTNGGNVLTRVSRSLEHDSDMTLQMYFDWARRNTAVFLDERQTFDADFQHTIPLADRHLVTWGGGYRLYRDDVENTFEVTLDPDARTWHLFSLFVQDEVDVIEDRLALTLGSKFEHNDFTGFEVQPNVRLSWTPRERQTLWGAVSRAVRTPSRAEHDIRLNQPPAPGAPVPTSLFGNPRFHSEELIAYELGYRTQPFDRVSLDLATFYNDYSELRSLEPTDPQVRAEPPPPHVGFEGGNRIKGESYGFELGANWQASASWRLYGSYSLLRIDLRQDEASGDPMTVDQIEGSNPRHQWLIRSSLDLGRKWEWDTWFRFVDELPAQGVEDYLEMDMRLAWRPQRQLQLAVVGRNLLDSSHREFSPSFVQTFSAEVPRSVYAKLTWEF